MTILRHVASADGTEIAVEQVSDGARDLLLVPGGPTLRQRWSGLVPLLEGRYACWVMDRRGKGDSGDTPPYSFSREFEDVRAAVELLSARGPVSVAGHSSGASIVLGAALLGMSAAELLLDEPPWPVDAPLTPAATIEELDTMIASGDREGALVRALTDVVGVSAPAVEGLRALPVWPQRVALVHTWTREMREVDRLPPVAELAAVTTPTTFLLGERSPEHLVRATGAIAPSSRTPRSSTCLASGTTRSMTTRARSRRRSSTAEAAAPAWQESHSPAVWWHESGFPAHQALERAAARAISGTMIGSRWTVTFQ